ncbi:MAG: methionine--tRNA ligase [Deltaproteobacteria bacterium]|nr:methionine--tRNA ligase [Candidatus Anaeroferrophillus wilburensis]MBN2889776.1 methionine--tRNA ligase [Deltaproteobacteria bacterium]
MTDKPKSVYYITTPIYYVNDVPHIGHAYTTVAADVMARYQRLLGREVFFLTGTDEHGVKIEKTAQQKGVTPRELVDQVVKRFIYLWEVLNISHDDFIRTTEDRHSRAVLTFFKAVQENQDIYLGSYEDWYCVPCETFWTDKQLDNGNCPECGRPAERLKEESYFFRMSKYQQRLLEHLDEHPDFILPPAKRNEILSFVREELRDLSISRTSFTWGIPVPDHEKHVIYVWFDALINYLTAAGYPDDPERFARLWPADVHLIGKDILRFHAVYWPTFLFAAGLPLPKKVFAHGWWTVEGEKMSKSLGNVIDPVQVAEEYGVDAFRYFLLREVPFGLDGDFSQAAMKGRLNSELANDLGNLFSRSISMISKYRQGVIPVPQPEDQRYREFAALADEVFHEVAAGMDDLAFSRVLQSIWKLVVRGNKFIDQQAPWQLAKDESQSASLDQVLYCIAEVLRLLSVYLLPFMPDKAAAMARQLGVTDQPDQCGPQLFSWGRLAAGVVVEPGQVLFPRLD